MSTEAKEVSEMLDAVSAKVPNLIRELMSSLYSPEAGANMGKAVGAFYKELISAGMPEDIAIKMAQDYMSTIKSQTTNMINMGAD
ncbi:MAG: hypothetical protein HFE63_03015 [Clostridiales bacterium]|nr:hypothetical protein [Clostridiales bacterium]